MAGSLPTSIDIKNGYRKSPASLSSSMKLDLPFLLLMLYKAAMAERRSVIPPLKPMTPEELREWRKARGLTQQQLAELLGVTRKAISNWECKERKIPPYLSFLLESLEKEGYVKK